MAASLCLRANGSSVLHKLTNIDKALLIKPSTLAKTPAFVRQFLRTSLDQESSNG
jgi:hypothetical protein